MDLKTDPFLYASIDDALDNYPGALDAAESLRGKAFRNQTDLFSTTLTPLSHVFRPILSTLTSSLVGPASPIASIIKHPELHPMAPLRHLTEEWESIVARGCSTPLDHVYSDSLAKGTSSSSGAESKPRLTLSLSLATYVKGDFLLPHDDGLGDEAEGDSEAAVRLAAVIVYLRVPEAGGDLVLYSSGEEGKVSGLSEAVRVQPVVNRALLFPVSPRSWHRVDEVQDGWRVALTGWILAPRSLLSPSYRAVRWGEEPISFLRTLPLPAEEAGAAVEWAEGTAAALASTEFAEQWADEGAMQLPGALADEEADRILDTLDALTYEPVGPLHVAHCSRVTEDATANPTVAAVLRALTSLGPLINDRFFADVDDTTFTLASADIRRFLPGDYTMVTDSITDAAHERVEVHLIFARVDDPDFRGGLIHYIDGGEEALLKIGPVHNSLSIVYLNTSDVDEEEEEEEEEEEAAEAEAEEEGETRINSFVQYVRRSPLTEEDLGDASRVMDVDRMVVYHCTAVYHAQQVAKPGEKRGRPGH
jgi:hypothetical protein